MKTRRKTYLRIITLLLSLLLFSACGQAGNAAGNAGAQGGETGAEIGAGEADQGGIPVTVEKVAPDTVTVSLTDEILNTVGEQNEIRIRFYDNDSRNGDMSYPLLRHIGQSVPSVKQDRILRRDPIFKRTAPHGNGRFRHRIGIKRLLTVPIMRPCFPIGMSRAVRKCCRKGASL